MSSLILYQLFQTTQGSLKEHDEEEEEMLLVLEFIPGCISGGK
jgi:hypothetical protein